MEEGGEEIVEPAAGGSLLSFHGPDLGDAGDGNVLRESHHPFPLRAILISC